MMQPGYGYGPPPSGARSEVPIFQADGVQVTSARFVCWQQTYPIAGITSVQPFVLPASTGWPTLWVFVSAFWALVWFGCLFLEGGEGKGGYVLGLAFSLGIGGIAVAVLRGKKPTHGVMISTAGMNVKALSSPNRDFVQAVLAALNQAIAMR